MNEIMDLRHPAVSDASEPTTAAETAIAEVVGDEGTFDGGSGDGGWPEDWRTQLAAGDARLERRLGRFASPRNVVDSLLAAELRLRGGADGPPDPDADPAALAAWRAGQGVPEAPDGYAVELPDGVVLGQDDQPVVDAFLQAAHNANMTPDQVNGALGWYLEHHNQMTAEQTAADRAAHDQAVDRLRETWGPDYRAQVNVLHGLLDAAPEDLKQNFLGARMADGTLLGDCAPVLEWLASLALAANPRATLTPSGASGPGKALGDEIAAIERRMATDRDAYFKDEPAQARYRDLIAARDGR